MTGSIRSVHLDASRIGRYPITIRFISTYEGPKTDLRISNSMCFFSCLHIHNTCPICAECEQKIRTGSLVPSSVNVAIVTILHQSTRRSLTFLFACEDWTEWD